MPLHGNMVGLEMPGPGPGCFGYIDPVFNSFSLSQIAVGQYHYPQGALGEDAGHSTQLKVNLDISYRGAIERSHSENSYKVRQSA